MPETIERTTCLRCGGKVERLPTPFPGLDVPLRYCETCAPIVEAEEAELERQRHADFLLATAGGGRTLREWSLDTFPDDDEGRRAKAAGIGWLDRYLAGERVNLLLFGPVGTGKTGLAWSLIRAACDHGTDAVFLNFRDYLWDLRESIRNPNWQADKRGPSASILALDDLGLERPTDFARDELAGLVYKRAENSRPTIVTSNYDPQELAVRLGHDDRRVGQRLVSRLDEDAVQFRFAGRDRRIAT